MNKRLIKLLSTRSWEIRGGQMLDTYNQQIHNFVSCTIRTNINTADHHFIVMEEPKIRQMGRGFNKGNLHNICPTITSNSFECNNFVINYIPFIPKTIDVQRLRLELLAKRKNITNYRIRKLTPRECFRLMGVEEKDIETLLNAGLSNTRLYALAGNSIAIDNLYHIFRTMFVDKPTRQLKQLTLF